ncbi:uncharacterized protein PV09_00538 [Verruconis gallopava]|uniref:Uncharacterized protein n=1 Tax=Verruconis gallopava TaxID=253628 RepID=A0A0D2BBB3_9PEZI|nr:uncharacterized protein PV09_00538 [Verruconis gallopava]KIW08574.1 hypothetical protein PV09_00538 [Verruconis gallopava]
MLPAEPRSRSLPMRCLRVRFVLAAQRDHNHRCSRGVSAGVLSIEQWPFWRRVGRSRDKRTQAKPSMRTAARLGSERKLFFCFILSILRRPAFEPQHNVHTCGCFSASFSLLIWRGSENAS